MKNLIQNNSFINFLFSRTIWKSIFWGMLCVYGVLFVTLLLSDIKLLTIANHPKTSVLVKSFIIAFVNIFVLTYIFKGLINKKIVCAGIPLVICMFCFSYVFFRVHNYVNYINYYVCLSNIFLLVVDLLCLIRRLKSYKLLLGKFLYVVFSFFLILISVAYFFHYKIYRVPFNPFALLGVMQTNFSEAKEYLISNFSFLTIVGVTLLVFAVLLIIANYFEKAVEDDFVFSKFSICITLLLLATNSLSLFYFKDRMFPFDCYALLHRSSGAPLRVFNDLNENLSKNGENVKIFSDVTQRVRGTVIVVIGESACRDRMKAFTPAFSENTTPWESKMKNSSDFSFHSQAYANFCLTILSLSKSLTNSNQYNGVDLKDSVSILDVANKAGYKTYWLSTQQKYGIAAAGISNFSKQADVETYINGYDMNLVAQLESIPSTTNNLVFIHINGSHDIYKNRFPKEIRSRVKFSNKNRYKNYDLSILYSDMVLQAIYEYAAKNLNLQAMVYFSDHGEDMKTTHSPEPFTFAKVRIPVWFYLSGQYQKLYPQTMIALRRHKDRVFTNDLIFDTLHGILQIKSNYYDPKYDLTNFNYNLLLNDAKTMWGKKKIADDPVLRTN